MKLSQNTSIIVSVFATGAILVGASAVFQSDETVADSQAALEQIDAAPEGKPSGSPDGISNVELISGDTVTIKEVLNALDVRAEESSETYDRDAFKHWTNSPGSGCDARDAVLKAEALPEISSDSDCPVPSAKWLSLYDGVLLTNPSKLDIDHMVPLAEAWRSGAHSWDDERREEYANDMGDPRALIAVSAGSNRSKSDQDPDEWLPEDNSYLCTYLADWVAVKYRWSLTLEQSEFDSIHDEIQNCTDTEVLVPELVAFD